MINSNEYRLAELLCSKLCHDLISPIGAINNGLEFLEDGSSDMVREAISLLGKSASQATNRLMFFRLAFGGWGNAEKTLFGSLRQPIQQFLDDRKIKVIWHDNLAGDNEEISIFSAKLLLNMIVVAADFVQRDGNINVSAPVSGNNILPKLLISGEKIRLREDIVSGLDTNLSADELTARNVVAYHSIFIAEKLAMVLKATEQSPNVIEISVV